MPSAAFSPDGQQMASLGFEGTVRVWNVADGQQIHVLHGHDGWTLAAAFSPDGNIIVSGGQDKTLRLWDADSGQHIRTLPGTPKW
jgi:WD40 repeat protein